MDDYLIGVLSNIGVISFIALSAYLLLLTGEISFGQQAFFAIGAYAAGIATALWGWPLAAALAWGAAIGAGAALLVGIPTLRLHGLYFAVATLAFAEMVRILFELFRYQIADRRRAGRAQWRRWISQYPLHLRQQHRRLSIPAVDLFAAGGRLARIHAARTLAPRRDLSHDRRGRNARRIAGNLRDPAQGARRRDRRGARRHRRRALCASDDLCGAAHFRRHARRPQPRLRPDRRARHRARSAARRSDRYRLAGIDQSVWPAIA